MNLAPIANLLVDRIGLDVTSLGATTFRAAAVERMQALTLTDPAAYAVCLAGRSDEFERLLDRLLVPETWFFRGGELFDFLSREISTRIHRILCLPCATGEEPYSLALSMLEAGVSAERVQIDGVDLSPTFIEAAKRGSYREFSFRQTDPELRSRYFLEAGNEWVLDSAVRGLVRFQVGNIMDASLFAESAGAYDLILCRNLLIYLTGDARLRAVANLERLLAPGGLLGVGHAEPQILTARGYQRFGPDSCFLFRRAAIPTKRSPSPARPLPASPTRPRKPARDQARVIPSPAVARPMEADSSLADARRLADQGRLDDALAVCRTHLEQSGPSANAYSLLGVIHHARGDQADAGEAFRKALYLDPDHREALTHAMLLSSRRGDEARAAALRGRLERIDRGDKP